MTETVTLNYEKIKITYTEASDHFDFKIGDFDSNPTASGDADDRPTEEVAFYYNKIAWSYDEAGDDPREIKVTYSESPDTAADPLPTEEVTLGYTEVEWTY